MGSSVQFYTNDFSITKGLKCILVQLVNYLLINTPIINIHVMGYV